MSDADSRPLLRHRLDTFCRVEQVAQVLGERRVGPGIGERLQKGAPPRVRTVDGRPGGNVEPAPGGVGDALRHARIQGTMAPGVHPPEHRGNRGDRKIQDRPCYAVQVPVRKAVAAWATSRTKPSRRAMTGERSSSNGFVPTNQLRAVCSLSASASAVQTR